MRFARTGRQLREEKAGAQENERTVHGAQRNPVPLPADVSRVHPSQQEPTAEYPSFPGEPSQPKFRKDQAHQASKNLPKKYQTPWKFAKDY